MATITDHQKLKLPQIAAVIWNVTQRGGATVIRSRVNFLIDHYFVTLVQQ